ncbi:MAG: indole acetimide hydrolase, partial [Gammaproteobacteria bacterium]|nr:indole acetimide hydrolase [Gammaproteobacteria bacterium]
LRRIEEVNPKVNAVTVVLAETAIDAAEQADASEATGALHGVPFTIKENIDCVGSATTQGMPVFAEAFPAQDGPTVERMKNAGAIPLARTNLPEYGLRIHTDNPLRGLTYNPWDRTRTAGGSSGGEASAIATGMSPIGLGNDIGGSLRNPAFCCGITSIKATTGRIPWAVTVPAVEQPIAYSLMVAEGPMARSVADLRLGLSVLAGRHYRDPVSVSAPLEGPEPGSKKVALVTSIEGCTLPPAYVDAIRAAGDILSASGWTVEECQPPEIGRINEIWGHLLASDIEQTRELIAPLMSEAANELISKLIETFPSSAMNNVTVHTERDRLRRAWSAFNQEYPLIVGPVWTDIPFVHDADVDPETGAETTLGRLRFITPGNLLGIPAVPVPMGLNEGLPVSVQIYADSWREDLCLDAAELIEAASGRLCPIDPTW